MRYLVAHRGTLSLLRSPPTSSPSGWRPDELRRPAVSRGAHGRGWRALRGVWLTCDMVQANHDIGDDWADMRLVLEAHDADHN